MYTGKPSTMILLCYWEDALIIPYLVNDQDSVNILLTAVASNRPTEALASVIFFTFVVYSHYKHS